jgi:dihydroorotate dehydrogenase electron transfer subunit
MHVSEAIVRSHSDYGSGYRLITFEVGEAADAAKPGQFVHVQVPRLEQCVLRRPFSIFRAADGCISVLYKCVGLGTRALSLVVEGESVSVVGPLGNGFPLDPEGQTPLLVGGGYGVAPLSMLAAALPMRGTLFVGGRTAADILCVEIFEEMGWEVCVATQDGSRGATGLVTDVLDAWVADHGDQGLELYACGPDGMLKAVGERSIAWGCKGWLSLDKHMGCGVGACLACVQEIRLPDGSTDLLRVCKDGPVFEAADIVWEAQA